MANFSFLAEKNEYAMFGPAAIEAERVYDTSPAMCAVGCRKALELAVKWVYAADNTMNMPCKDNLMALIHENSFRYAVDYNTWGKLLYIVRLGNLSVHTEKSVNSANALASLQALFEFVQWIDYCYGADYEERKFDEKQIPAERVIVDTRKIKEQESLLDEKEAELEKLRRQVAAMSAQLTAEKEQKKAERTFNPEDISEFKTRKMYIDVELKELGWKLDGSEADVREEYPVEDMAGISGQQGFADYVLFGRDGLPLAVVEAKKTAKDPNVGRKQAVLYADCLEKKFGRRPMMFTTNGFETYFWDDLTGPQRPVSSIFSRDDLQKLMNRRGSQQKLNTVKIDDRITDRVYQKEAIRAVCDSITEGIRRNLLVMATGTGKTRTAASLSDVLSRGGYVTNILFLADRTALVKQARDDFKNYLPDMSLCNLCTNRDDRNARIVFSTYPTMLNAIDREKNESGERLFTPAHFDLIIIDESHRSIFKKYRAIFDYFDAYMVGLTATPKTDVDRNTYDFFEMEHGVPTFAYDYETAIADKVLVPYYNYEVKLKFLEEGITYDELSAEDKARFEEDFAEDGGLPEEIPSAELNKFVFNEDTVDTVLQDLMERGIKVAGGDRLGKTIIFAQNKRHAEFIIKRFDKLYPQYKGTFAQRVICDDSYAQTIIDDFKQAESAPHIAVSVDMMDTGIDVPEVVNLVFFKKVRSKTKFWQMIGRGTRLCKDLSCIDTINSEESGEYTGKRWFLIFDYCGNFEFFREHKEGYESNEAVSLTESIFAKRIRLISMLQEGEYTEEAYRNWRRELVDICRGQVTALNRELVAVRLQLRYAEKYRQPEPYVSLSDTDKGELVTHIAPLVTMDDDDEAAKRFDNLMYGLILAEMGEGKSFKRLQSNLRGIASELEKKTTIPQVNEKLSTIKEINTDAFWEAKDVLPLERVRVELRGLIKFLGGEGKRIIVTDLKDAVVGSTGGQTIDSGYDFEDYKAKVNRFVNENGNMLAIYKLTHNVALTALDYSELERVFTEELGSKEDYAREYGETPFGLIIRKIAKLDHEAAMEAFSEFINDESLNQKQIAFVRKVISYVEANGYIENVDALKKAPFDRPVAFGNLFDANIRTKLLEAVRAVRENAVKVTAAAAKSYNNADMTMSIAAEGTNK